LWHAAGVAKGSSWFPPIKSILKPCRIIQVQKHPTSFEVTGETHLEGQPVVSWNVRTFEFASSDDLPVKEAEANDAAIDFARRTPVSFAGHVYVVDSRARLHKIRIYEPDKT
jgi:hypothetical protein